MSNIPQDKALDSTLWLILDGYNFIANRCRRYRTDIFETRLLFRKTICLTGDDAALVFYDTRRFQRRGAAPHRVKETLFGKEGVQGLDDEAHLNRKKMFMSLMTPQAIRQMTELMAVHWNEALGKWEATDRVVLLPEVQEILCRSVFRWAGVPLAQDDVAARTRDLAETIDSAGALGPRHWKGRMARNRSEKWAGSIIEDVRAQRLTPPDGSAARVISGYRDQDGRHLDRHTAAVELLNVLRPTVAVSRFVVFTALALYEHPECLPRLQAGDEEYIGFFVHEVRRFYPFFPFVAARVRSSFDWKGYSFPGGRRVILDLYGTDHDERLWKRPDEFRPERFLRWSGSAFNFIPQGGGNHFRNHRCPGERLTIELMKTALRLLTTAMRYDIPEQDLRISLRRMPANPKSGFVISNVRPA
jgi:fatty-acid peroxygenase